MKSILKNARSLFVSARVRSITTWKQYRGLKTWQQVSIAVLVAVVLMVLMVFARGGETEEPTAKGRTVTLATVSELAGTGGSVDLIGSVRSVTEANILAQSGGTVRSVRTRIGGSIPAGYIIAELENAAERASVLQAEGAYDAAIAARSAQSLPDTQTAGRDAYRSAFTGLDITLRTQIDRFFGEQTAVGPELLIYPGYDKKIALSRERQRIQGLMNDFESSLAGVNGRSPQALLDEAESITRQIQAFGNQLADAANQRDSRVTPTQVEGLATARTSINNILTNLASARSGLRSGTVGATASADASVKQALGSLRAAQANLERTFVRAPIGGQVNFLPIRVGDYVTPLQHVATVAQNGALEIVAYVSEDQRSLLLAGGSVTVQGQYEGIITSVAPALDPVTKQIEVRIAVTEASELINGQSVHIALPDATPNTETVTEREGPTLLPLTAVKLRAGDRIVFSVDEDKRLIAHPVIVGEVRGDRIEVLTEIPADLRIVADARGLSEGEQVEIASSVR